MHERDTCSKLASMGRIPAPPPRGVLRGGGAAPDGHIEHQRILPAVELAPFIEHFWSVRWDLRAPFVVETLPHPSVHIVFESPGAGGRAEAGGVRSRRFVRTLQARGAVFGIKFRPATFAPVLGARMSSFTDRVVPIDQVLGAEGAGLARAITASIEDMNRSIERAESFLVGSLPVMPDEVAALRDLVERLATDRTLVRAADAAREIGLDVRTLQRRFASYVGVTPKWVIQRCRLHEAAEQLAREDAPTLARVAASAGYSDQSHFVRDFKAFVGRSPGRFRAGT